MTEHHPKSFFDYRFENYSPEVAGEYAQLRHLFEPSPDADPATVKPLFQEAEKWRPILAKHAWSCPWDTCGGGSGTRTCGIFVGARQGLRRPAEP